MKLDKKSLSLIVIVFVVLALIVAVPELFNDSSDQKKYLTDARAYYEKDLCMLAIDEYKKALSEDDSIEIALEMAEVYCRAYENGELTRIYTIEKYFDDLLTEFKEESAAYDVALKFYQKYEDYSSIIEILTQAKKLNVKSDIISEVTENVKYKYEIKYSAITDVQRSVQGFYTVKDGASYYIYDSTMRNVFSRTFDYASVYINDHLIVKQNEYVFILNSDGKRVAYLDDNIDFSTGLGGELFACRSNNIFSYYNLSGEKVFGEYLFAGRFRDGYAAVQTKQGWTIIDAEGKPVFEKFFEDIKCGSSYESVTNGCFFGKENGGYYLYNIKGEKVSDLKFDDCDVFVNKDSYAAVSVAGKWGFINVDGELVINAQFDSAKSFSNGFAFVTSAEKGFFVDVDGNKTITGDFKEGDYFNANGLCLVKGDAFWQPIQRYYTLN